MLEKLPFRKQEENPVDREIARLMSEMDTMSMFSEEYDKALDHLERLKKLKNGKRLRPINWDTVIIAGANLLGVLIIVAYEQKHVITTKAFNERIRPVLPNSNPTPT